MFGLCNRDFGFTRLSPRTSAQDRCKLLAYINIVIWVIYILICVILLILLIVYKQEVVIYFKKAPEKKDFLHFRIILPLLLLALGVQFYLNMILYQGAKKRDFRKINRWMKVAVIFWIFETIGTIFSFCFEKTPMNVFDSFGIIWTGFCIWIVYSFRSELKRDLESSRILYEVPSGDNIQESQLHNNIV